MCKVYLEYHRLKCASDSLLEGVVRIVSIGSLNEADGSSKWRDSRLDMVRRLSLMVGLSKDAYAAILVMESVLFRMSARNRLDSLSASLFECPLTQDTGLVDYRRFMFDILARTSLDSIKTEES